MGESSAHFFNYFCKGWVQALLLLDEWISAQLAQYNEFIDNGFKNRALVRVATTRHGYGWIE